MCVCVCVCVGGGGDLYDRYVYVKGLTTVAGSEELTVQYTIMYRVARNFCCGLFLRNGDFLYFAGTNFCDSDRLVFLAGN